MRWSTGRPRAVSTATAWTFIDTSVRPAARPNTSRAPARAGTLRLAPTSAMAPATPSGAARTRAALPYRAAIRPATCMDTSAPATGHSSAAPSCASVNDSAALNWGIWVNQAERVSPTTKNTAATALMSCLPRGRCPAGRPLNRAGATAWDEP